MTHNSTPPASRREVMMGAAAIGAAATIALASSASASEQERLAVNLRELPITSASKPFMSAAPLERGYTEREFAMQGKATLFDLQELETWTLKPVGEQAYSTRLMVRRPADPKKFNGTVIIDWLNVTMQFDLDGEWLTQHEVLTAEGFAYIGVTTQKSGAAHLAKWDSQRYPDASIPDDGLSYGIYSDAARVVRERAGELLGGLKVKHLVGAGASQSAWRLTSYINAFHPRDLLFDGFLLRGRGLGGTPIRGDGIVDGPRPAPIRPDLNVPVLIVQNEGDLLALKYVYEREPDSARLRVWEIAGSAHGGRESTAEVQARAVANRVTIPTGADGSGASPNIMRTKAVGVMAYRYIHRWVSKGTAPPQAPRISRTRDAGPPPGPPKSLADFVKFDPSILARDEHGNALGGLRLPDIDVPLGQILAATPTNLLGGEFKPFSPQELKRLYPTKADYVAKVRTSAQRAAKLGYIDKTAAAAFVQDAESSSIPDALPEYASGAR